MHSRIDIATLSRDESLLYADEIRMAIIIGNGGAIDAALWRRIETARRKLNKRALVTGAHFFTPVWAPLEADD